MTHKLVGFDRKIHLSWLDATADWASQGLPAAEIRKRLDRLLDGQVAGIGSHSARGKTMTVLMHVWVLVPDTLVPLRDDGLLLLRDRGEDSRLPLHWGMCLAGYPFFRDVAATTGRLLSLQGPRPAVPDRPAHDRVVGCTEHREAGRTASRPFIRRMGSRRGDRRTGHLRAGATDRRA